MITAIIDEVLGRIKNEGEATEPSQLKAVLTSALEKMDIVSRTEFDTQTAVLLRTREKITSLEQQLAAIEKQLSEST